MFEQIIPLLRQIADDRTVPKNIRTRCEEAIRILEGGQDKAVKINTVISSLDEVTNDPNIPMYTRTMVWNIVSLLEAEQKA